jgi:insertion element IS1 protein InsB
MPAPIVGTLNRSSDMAKTARERIDCGAKRVDALGHRPRINNGASLLTRKRASLPPSPSASPNRPLRGCSWSAGIPSGLLGKKVQLIDLIQQVVAPIYGDSLEIDELVVRFGRKCRYRYLWIVVSRLSRQVLAYFVGDRSRKSLRHLWQRVPVAYRRKLVSTDEYEVYAEVFRPWQYRPTPKGSGRTSVIEGLNNTWRTRVAGLVRKTVCVQALADLDERLRLVFNQHNLHCRERLRKLGWTSLSMH